MSSVRELVQRHKLQLAKKMKELQRQADMLKAMDEMGDTEIQLELFDMLDVDNDGHIQVQNVMAWISASEYLLNNVTPADLDTSDGYMDRTQFGHLLETLVAKAGGTLKDWAELLVLRHRLPGSFKSPEEIFTPEPQGFPEEATELMKAPEDVSLEGMVAVTACDGRMRDLFTLFDMDLDGRVGFKDVAIGLHKIAPHLNLEQASEAALRVLLSYDKDQDRKLSYNEFVHFICAFLHASGISFNQVAGALVYAAARPDPPEEEQRRLEALAAAIPQDAPTYMDWRTHRIFELFDHDKDDLVSFKELVLGLHRFEPSTPLNQTAAQAAAMLGRADLKGVAESGVLDRAQFARVLDKFVTSTGASFDQVADYLVAVSAAGWEGEEGAHLPGWWFQRFVWEGDREPGVEVKSARTDESADEMRGEWMEGRDRVVEGTKHLNLNEPEAMV